MAAIAFGCSSFALLRAKQNDAAPESLLCAQNFSLLRLKQNLRSCSSPARWRSIGVPRASVEVVDDRLIEREEKERVRVLRVGVICGGPSAERGISLNSARSVLDHIQGGDIHVNCYYIDPDLNAFAISPAQVYSNTPADFDFKLASLAQGFESLSDFAEHLAASVDIVFPVIHGKFGEDGGIQELLEKYNIPFVGTGSSECCQAFDKYNASLELSRQGFITVPSCLIQGSEADESELSKWFARNQLDPKSGKVVDQALVLRLHMAWLIPLARLMQLLQSFKRVLTMCMNLDHVGLNMNLAGNRRELIPESSLKSFLKEGVSLQLLFLMWDLVQIAILLYYYQVRWNFNSMAVLMLRRRMQLSTTGGNAFQHSRLPITLHLVLLLMSLKVFEKEHLGYSKSLASVTLLELMDGFCLNLFM